MSCWRKYTADMLKNVDEARFVEACERMNLGFDNTVKKVESPWEDGSADVDGVLTKDGHKLTIGIKFQGDDEGHLTVEGDFWNTGVNATAFLSDLGQAYAAASLKYQLQYNFGMYVEMDYIDGQDIVLEAYSM